MRASKSRVGSHAAEIGFLGQRCRLNIEGGNLLNHLVVSTFFFFFLFLSLLKGQKGDSSSARILHSCTKVAREVFSAPGRLEVVVEYDGRAVYVSNCML